MYMVAQKSKLLSAYVNKTEEDCEQKRTATEKMKYCLIFSCEIFYVTVVLFKYSMTESNQ